MGARTLGVVFPKGGTAKTTTAINVAAAFAGRGQSTLLIDFDPQASATRLLGADPNDLPVTSRDVLLSALERRPLPRDAVLQVRDQLQLLPADATLATLDHFVPAGGELLLRRLVKSLDAMGRWDWIVIDSQPSLGLPAMNVLLAASELLVAAHVLYASQIQLDSLFDILHSLERLHDMSWRRVLIVPTMVEVRTTGTAIALARLREQYGAHLSKTYVRRNMAIAYAQAEAKAVQWYAATSPGAQDYNALADELLQLPSDSQEVRAS